MTVMVRSVDMAEVVHSVESTLIQFTPLLVILSAALVILSAALVILSALLVIPSALLVILSALLVIPSALLVILSALLVILSAVEGSPSARSISQQSHADPLRSIRARLWVCPFQIERAPCLSASELRER